MKTIKQEINIPKTVTLDIANGEVKVKGSFGELERNFSYPLIKFSKEEDKLVISTKKQTKTVKMFMNTYKAHIQNMIQGVSEKFVYKLKICSGHFPITVALESQSFVIKNFLGEKIPRKTKLPSNVEVKIEGDTITLTSPSKESAGLAASKIEQATRITGKDRRRFQDGIYIIEKSGKKLK